MRVYVTGASGFVGSSLTPALLAAGHHVVAADREVDVTDLDQMTAALAAAAPDAVIHLAAMSSVATSFQRPDLTWHINYVGTRTVLQAVRDCAPGARVLLIGSADQYSPTAPESKPLTEQTVLRPRSPYAKSKAAAERLAVREAEAGLDLVCVRAFNHTGPGQTDTFVAPDFAHQLARIGAGLQDPVMRVGNLESVRDFLDVRDVITAYVRLIEPDVSPDIYNLASGRGLSIRELLDTLCGHASVFPKIETDPARHRPTDWLVGDVGRLQSATQWRPHYDFDQTLDDVLSYWKQEVERASERG